MTDRTELNDLDINDPNDVSDTMLMALADDELSGDMARTLRDLIDRNEDLAARYAVFVDSRAMVQAAFPREPIPDRLVETIRSAPATAQAAEPVVVPFRSRAAQPLQWATAIAASLLLAVGGFWAGQGVEQDVYVATPIAAAQALASTPTGEEVTLQDGSLARALGSYVTDAGLCRLIGHEDQRHLVCRDDASGNWAAALSIVAGGSNSYFPASDVATGVIDRVLDELGAGPALTGSEELDKLQAR